MQDISFFQVFLQESPVILFVNTFQDNSLEILLRFQNPRFGSEGFYVSNSRIRSQRLQQGIRKGNRYGFVGGIIVEIGYLNMRTESDDFIPHFFLESDHNGYRKNHDSQA